MRRKKEKEVMDEETQVTIFAQEIKNSPSNMLFLNYLSGKIVFGGKKILDLGCGTAEILTMLLSQNSSIKKIVGIDASQRMIDIGRESIVSLEMTKKISLIKKKIPGIDKILKKGDFDIIISKHLLHHIPNPHAFWKELEKISVPKTEIFVWDFIRPKNIMEAKKIVARASFKNKQIEKDFYNSLLASFTVEEVEKQLVKTKLNLEIKEIKPLFFIVQKKFK